MPFKKATITFKADNTVNVEITDSNFWEEISESDRPVTSGVSKYKNSAKHFLSQPGIEAGIEQTVAEYNKIIGQLALDPLNESLKFDLLVAETHLNWQVDSFNADVKTVEDYLMKDYEALAIKIVTENAKIAGLTIAETETLLADAKAKLFNMPVLPTNIQDMIELLNTPEADKYNNYSECFAPGTLISLPGGKSVTIEQIGTQDDVASFDQSNNDISQPLKSAKVVKLYCNVTQEFLRLTFPDNRDPLIVTPNHAFLDKAGTFTKIIELVDADTKKGFVVDETGAVIEINAERLVFDETTADMFERSNTRRTLVNGVPVEIETVPEGWATYNFEVAGFHTYIANGVRVHNDSGFLGRIGNIIDNEFFDKFGALGDGIGDIITAPFHGIGQIVNGVTGAIEAVGAGSTEAFDRFSEGDIIGGVAAIGKGIGNAIGEIGRAVGEGLRDIGKAVADGLKAVGQGIKDAVDSIFGRNDDNDGRGDDSSKPIIIDLDGDGIEVNANSLIDFDMDADGFLEQTSWAAADDGFLVIDLNADGSRGEGDGKIDQTNELVFSNWLEWEGATDLQALATFDQWEMHGGNNDGVLNAQDAIWSELRIWQDANQNGVTDEGELKTLSELGITQINLQYDDSTDFSDISNDLTIYGNTILGTASYVRNGVVITGGVGDMSLSYKAEGWRRVEIATGYRIELENNENEEYRVLDGAGSTIVDVAGAGIAGAIGDNRNNILKAINYDKAVTLSGRDGDDVLTGGNKDDVISGDMGADKLYGKNGNDTLFFDADDVVVDGGNGLDIAHYIDDADLTFDLNAQNIEELHSGNGNDTLTAQGSTENLAIFASGGNDIVTAGSGDDTLDGGSGNDTLKGFDGADFLYGGTGNDNLFGGDGDDYLIGAEGRDFLTGGAGADYLQGGRGNDTLKGGTGDDNYYFKRGDGKDVIDDTNGNDTLVLGPNIELEDVTFQQNGSDLIIYILPKDNHEINLSQVTDTIKIKNWQESGSGVDFVKFASGLLLPLSEFSNNAHVLNDSIFTEHFGNMLIGSGNNDLLEGLNERDSLFGVAGNDILIGRGGNDALLGGMGNDTLLGGTGNDELKGEAGDDLLFGDNGVDTLIGGAGADILYGGKGDDILNGGDGNDIYIFNRGDGKDTIRSNSNGIDIISFGPNIDLKDLKVVRENGQIKIYLMPANNATTPLNEVNDVITLSSGAVYGLQLATGTTYAFLGNGRVIDGQEYQETYAKLVELFGEDIIPYFSETGTNGRDWYEGTELDDAVYGGEDHDIIQGRAGNDIILGGDGADTIIGGDGNDTMRGENGADTISGGTGNDILDGGSNNDLLNGGDGDDTIAGGTGNDLLQGANGNDTLNGDSGEDTLYGGRGNDTLNGGSGNDFIMGQSGNDLLTGGSGDDKFVFTHVASGNDVITDFKAGANSEDTISFDESVFLNFDAVIAASQNNGQNTVIDLGNNNSITLNGVSVSQLHADDFEFV